MGYRDILLVTRRWKGNARGEHVYKTGSVVYRTIERAQRMVVGTQRLRERLVKSSLWPGKSET